MSVESATRKFEDQATAAQAWFQNEIAGLRTGRVKTNLVESLPVEHYGVRTPLQGLASISLSDARTIVISPWDPGALGGIEKAITEASLGVQPVVDGKSIRISFPSLTKEIREQTVKQLHHKAEETRVKLRQARDESLTTLKQEKGKSDITEDDFYEGKKKLDDLIDKANGDIADLIKKKEEEIKTI